MGPGESALTHGTIMVGLIIGFGYLLIFPFWMIYKLDRIEKRLKLMQEDMDAQDDVLDKFKQRIEELDSSLEERRKEIIEAMRFKQDKPIVT
jgi:hypothetical protein